MTEEKSLYEQLGGKETVKIVVAKLYQRILGDDDLAPFFENIDMDALRRSQAAFVTYALGGPHQYTGRDLRTAHERMVKEQGLTDKHFDLVAGHLKSVLIELNVDDEKIGKVMAIISTTRPDVLGK